MRRLAANLTELADMVELGAYRIFRLSHAVGGSRR